MRQGQRGKSIYNKLVVLSQVMKQYDRPKLLKASDWPKFVETVRPIYEDFELAKLLKVCTPLEEEVFIRIIRSNAFRSDSLTITSDCAVSMPDTISSCLFNVWTFKRHYTSFEAISGEAVAAAVKKYVALAGRDANLYGGHSMRRGLCTSDADH
jgi:hypothetical protein